MKHPLPLLALVILAATIYFLLSGTRRRTRTDRDRRASFERRIALAKKDGPDETVAAAADYLQSNLRRVKDKRHARRVADEVADLLVDVAEQLNTKGKVTS